MNLRLSTAAGFLAAATLLSGSAFAFAPQFNDELPTVIITDEIEAPSGGVFDPNQGTSRKIFRFTDAYDLFAYIDLGSATQGEVKMLFTEYPDDGSAVPASPGVILINSEEPAAAVPTTSADFAAAPILSNSLTFWNRDFTPANIDLNDPNAEGTYVGTITGHDVLSGPQSRVITMFLAGGPSTEVSDPKSFFVITTVGEGDSLSTPALPTNPWSPHIPASNDFGGWTANGLGLMALIPTSGAFNPIVAHNGPGPSPETGNALGTSFTDYAGFTLTPATVIGAQTAAGTTSLTAAIAATKVGFVGFGSPAIAAGLEANKLYRLRSAVSTTDAAQREEWRVRFGNEGLVGQSASGNLKSTAAQARPMLGTTVTNHYSYLLTKGSGTTNTFNIFYEVIGEGNAQFFEAANRGQSVSASEYELSVANRADLTGANVLVNRGGTFTADAAEVAPVPATPDAFVNRTGTARVAGEDITIFDRHGNVPRTHVTTGSAHTMTVQAAVAAGVHGATPPAGAIGFPWFSRIWFQAGGDTDLANPSNVGPFTVVNDKIYIADVWLSSSKATVQVHYPQLRLGLQVSSMIDFGIYNLSTDQAVGIGTAAKAYHTVSQRQDKGATLPTPTYGHVTIDFLGSDQLNTQANAPVDIVIHRIAVTEYDALN